MINKVAIIGAGASGLISAKVMKDHNFQIDVFEKNSVIGGVWVYRKEGVIYNNLVTNLPKTLMQFSDKYPFIGISDKSFVSHTEVLDYLTKFCQIYQLYKDIKFNSQVKNIERKDNQWRISYIHDNKSCVKTYDAVIVCNGHYQIPSLPKIENLHRFKGKIIHSSNYDIDLHSELQDKTVIVIGMGPSASDVVRLIKPISKKIYVINRRLENNHIIKDNVYQVGGIKSILGDYTFLLENKDIIYANYIICATGYEYNIPFLNKEYISYNNGSVKPLYQHIFHIYQPTLCFVGLPHPVMPFFMSYLQSCWIANTFKKNTLANLRERVNWFITYEKYMNDNNIDAKKYHYMKDSQFIYYKTLAKYSNLLNSQFSKYIDESEKIYLENWNKMPKNPGDPDQFRNIKYSRKY